MDVLTAIRTRRSIGKLKPDPVPRRLIEQMLEMATWAPNHHRTEPWRFIVISGDARRELGEAMATSLADRLDPSDPRRDELLLREREKPLRAPVLIAVYVARPHDDHVPPIEEIEATACAVQNLLLTAHALGLAAAWRTGEVAYDPAVKRHLGIDEDQHLAGFIYVGYPAIDPPPVPRKPWSDRTRWVGQGVLE